MPIECVFLFPHTFFHLLLGSRLQIFLDNKDVLFTLRNIGLHSVDFNRQFAVSLIIFLNLPQHLLNAALKFILHLCLVVLHLLNCVLEHFQLVVVGLG